MKKLRVGIIGTGTISHEHIQAYQKLEHVELVALCDINPQQLAYMSKKFGVVETYSTKEEMFAQANLDAVSVCTWNAAHAECTINALNAGLHVLCEKPMAVSTEEALQMEAAAIKNDRLLMIGFVRRFGNDAQVVMDFNKDNFFGDIYYGKATYLRRNGNPGGWFGDKSLSGGGPLIDLGVHVIDLLSYLMGKHQPVSVYGATFQKLFNRPHIKDGVEYQSSTNNEKAICNVEDLATAMIRFDNGSVISVEASFSLNIKEDEGKIELFGTKGGASLNPELELFTDMNGYMTNIQLKSDTALSMEGLFFNEVAHFVDCILNDTACLTPASDGISIMKILDAIYESAATGHEVRLEE